MTHQPSNPPPSAADRGYGPVFVFGDDGRVRPLDLNETARFREAPGAYIRSAPATRHSQSDREGLSTHLRAAAPADGAMVPS